MTYSSNPLSANNTMYFSSLVSGGGGSSVTLITSAVGAVPTSTSLTSTYDANSIKNIYDKVSNDVTAVSTTANTASATANGANTLATSATTVANASNTTANSALVIGGALSDENQTVLSAVSNQLSLIHTLTITSPYRMRVLQSRSPVFTLQTNPLNTITLDILVNGVSIYSLKPTMLSNGIADSGTISTTFANAGGIINSGDTVRIALFNNAANNACKGLKFYIFNS